MTKECPWLITRGAFNEEEQQEMVKEKTRETQTQVKQNPFWSSFSVSISFLLTFIKEKASVFLSPWSVYLWCRNKCCMISDVQDGSNHLSFCGQKSSCFMQTGSWCLECLTWERISWDRRGWETDSLQPTWALFWLLIRWHTLLTLFLEITQEIII